MEEKERENMKKRKDKRGADIATAKSRSGHKARKMATQLPLEKGFYYCSFFQFISIRFTRGAKLDLFDTSSLYLLLLSVYVTFVRFENDRDTTNRSYGSIAGLTMLDFTKRATRIRFAVAKISSTSSENQYSFYDTW